jgi:1-deoxy-D-xylulose-5-phosphate reductoisomerase
VQLLGEQVREFRPELISVASEAGYRSLKELLPAEFHGRIVVGGKGNETVAAHTPANMTISAIVGAAGLLPTLAAIRAGKDIGLANKETLVMAGRIVMAEAEKYSVRMLPVDSEHSAIFQALEAGQHTEIQKLILTASGGPFREKSLDELGHVSPADALKHPNWNMGRKISIDSATLMNKGLEVIEARWLFDVDCDRIEVVIHPQSIVHSLVEFVDGSVVAQLGPADMRIPIAYALSYPQRLPLAMPSLNLVQMGKLDFFAPKHHIFPALELAFDALREGGVLPAVFNAANEVAVASFLDGQLSFLQIAETVERVMDTVPQGDENNLEEILQADLAARHIADKLVKELSN